MVSTLAEGTDVMDMDVDLMDMDDMDDHISMTISMDMDGHGCHGQM